MPGTVRILAIDGGGIRGVIPARVLQEIEQRTGSRITDLFHMVAGTSTGGILAVGLSTPGPDGTPKFSARDLLDLYRDEGGRIFSHSFWHGFGSLGGTVDEKYEADNLERILQDRLGDSLLSAALTDLLVTSYDIERRRPFFFKSWRARGEDLGVNNSSRNREFKLRDIARATSAAPTYFEPALIESAVGTRYTLVDGGVFANNPAECAMASARLLYPNAGNYLLVSLGTGLTERPIAYEDAKDWGLFGWARPLLNVIFDGVSDTVDYQLDQDLNRGRVQRYFRFQTDLGADADDPEAPNDDMDDARPENIARLEAKVSEMLQKNRRMFTRLIDRVRRPKDSRASLIA